MRAPHLTIDAMTNAANAAVPVGWGPIGLRSQTALTDSRIEVSMMSATTPAPTPQVAMRQTNRVKRDRLPAGRKRWIPTTSSTAYRGRKTNRSISP